MENIGITNYEPPVTTLLTYGIANHASPEQWPNYLALGLGPEHIPDLVRMATDKELNEAYSDRLEVWAPLHAWRALGQLRAEEAAKPLLSLCEIVEDYGWMRNELPEVFAMIGPVVLPLLHATIADASSRTSIRTYAISSVEKMADRRPETRPTCIAILMQQLERFAKNNPMINGSLILKLVALQATEAAPLIEKAFMAESVDPLMTNWEDVQVELGWRPTNHIGQGNQNIPTVFLPPYLHTGTLSEHPIREKHPHGATHKKTKEKMAKQSRKKNRKR